MSNDWWVLDMVKQLQDALSFSDTMTYSEEREWRKIQEKIEEGEDLSIADVNFIEKQHRRYNC